jgi:hypothetical protein
MSSVGVQSANCLRVARIPNNFSWEFDMAEYMLFMHNDVVADDQGAWEPYLQTLKQNGVFEGGSEIGEGVCVRKSGAAPPITEHLGGYIRVTAATIDHATSLLAGNPHFEAGGTVEIRELTRT